MINYITKLSWGTITIECKFDDKKSIYNGNTPRWFLQYLYAVRPNTDLTGVNQNNIIELKQNEDTSTYTYEYDEDGYPTSMECEGYYQGWGGFEYF